MAERYPEDNQDLSRQQKLAYYAAKLKAVKKSERDSRAMDAVYQLRMENRKFFKVMPDLDVVSTYPLKERTDLMKENKWWYRYKLPVEEGETEVILQLWEDATWNDRKVVMEVGDLYRLNLEIPSGGEMKLYVLVESAESRRAEESKLFFSVYDVGDAEQAYTIPSEGFETYIMYREDNWRTRKECDARMLYMALGDQDQLNDISLDDFRELSMASIKTLKENMVPGNIYRRPTSVQALLKTRDPSWDGGVEELLRMESEDSIKMNLDMKFESLTLTESSEVKPVSSTANQGGARSKKRSRRRRRGPRSKHPRFTPSSLLEGREELVSLPEKSKKDIMSLFTRCMNPTAVAGEEDRAIWDAIDHLDQQPIGTSVLVPIGGEAEAGFTIQATIRLKDDWKPPSPPQNLSPGSGGSPGAELSFMGNDSSSTFNRSEAEAVDPDFNEFIDEADRVVGWQEDDLDAAVVEDESAEDEVAVLEVIPENEAEDQDQDRSLLSTGTEGTASVEARSPVNPLDLPEINFSPGPSVPRRRNDDSFVFNDSLEGWNTFLARRVNDSDIVNVSSEDSAKKSTQGLNGNHHPEMECVEEPYPNDILDEQGQIRVFDFE